jgi:hypothetical protein
MDRIRKAPGSNDVPNAGALIPQMQRLVLNVIRFSKIIIIHKTMFFRVIIIDERYLGSEPFIYFIRIS